jgi:predicted nucleotidyltransferase
MDGQKIKLDGKVMKKHGVSLVLLFGSQVSGGTHSGSDVDIGVLFENPKMVIQNPVEIYSDLLSEFGKVFPGIKIDIVYLHETSLALQFRAVSDGVLLYEILPTTFADYKETVLKLYFDFKFFEDILNEPFKRPKLA